MHIRIKNVVSMMGILLLLPYVAVMFWGIRNEPKTSKNNDMEMYVCQEAAAVLPKDSELEMIKAQLVLIRTNVIRENAIDSDVSIRGLESEDAAFRESLLRASEATRGKILTYEGNAVEAAYHAVSNGKTRDGKECLGEDVPYLISVDCPQDIYAEDYLLRLEIEKDKKIEILERDTAGYVKRVRFGDDVMTGDAFREHMELNSSDFTISEEENCWVITTKGCGHGLGMSQYSANQMAREGDTYEEILTAFFPGTELKISE